MLKGFGSRVLDAAKQHEASGPAFQYHPRPLGFWASGVWSFKFGALGLGWLGVLGLEF